MAVVFTPHSTGAPIVIGGQTGSGPFPKYSVSKSVNILSQEGTILNSKYEININGKIIVDSAVDITDPGARQSDYNARAAQRIDWLKQNPNAIGKLEIIPYGGKPGKLIYNDAKLMSVSISESPEDSSAVVYTDYAFSFEATVDVSIGDSGITTSQFDYDKFFIESINESWSIDFVEDVNYTGDDLEVNPERTYSITHSVSATGLRKPLSGGGFDKSAWFEAQKWVNTRLVTNPLSVIATDFLGGNQLTSFNPTVFGNAVSASFANLTAYTPYNHTRIPESNLTEGSYSVTESWTVSKKPYSIELNVDTEIEESGIITMNMSGSITGYDTQSLNSTTINKLSNAELGLVVVNNDAYNICKKYYDIAVASMSLQSATGAGTFALRNTPNTRSTGRNPGTGVITFSYGFNDKPALLTGSITTDLTIVDDNEFWDVEIIAVIPILAKVGGPIIQKMKTSRERKRSLQLDSLMGRNFRVTKPNGRAILPTYMPSGDKVTIQSIVENWSPTTGSYSLSVDWVY